MHGLLFFDQPGLQQQGAEFTSGLDPFNAPYFLGNAHLAGFPGSCLKMRHHPAAQLDTFADVQRQRAFAKKQVDTGRLGDLADVSIELGRECGAALHQCLGVAADVVCAQLLRGHAQPRQHHVHVAHGPVAGKGGEAMALHDGVQTVALVLRIQLARQTHGAQGLDAQGHVHAGKFVEQETVVKAHVVGYQHGAFQQTQQVVGHLVKAGRLLHHGVADAGQVLNEGRYGRARVDQTAPARDFLAAFHSYSGNLGDPVMHRIPPGGFQIKHDIAGQHGALGCVQQNIRASQAGSSRTWVKR